MSKPRNPDAPARGPGLVDVAGFDWKRVTAWGEGPMSWEGRGPKTGARYVIEHEPNKKRWKVTAGGKLIDYAADAKAGKGLCEKHDRGEIRGAA